MTESTPGPPGTIWSTGVHQVYVNKQPARVRVTQDKIPDAFRAVKNEIERNGGITLGVDHFPEELLEQFPILKEMNPLNVGRALEVAADENRIYATKTEHTNPLIAELYAQGKLTDHSIVADMIADVDETDEADYLFNGFKNIRRIDYVGEGGCKHCKVGAVPDNLVLTAKLSMEVDKLTNENKVVTKLKKQLKDNPDQLDFTPDEINELKQLGESDETVKGLLDESKLIEPEKESGSDELDEGVKTYIDGKFDEIKNLIKTEGPEESQMEARLAELEKENKTAKLEAQKAVINSKIDAKIEEGTVKPAQREGLLEAGLSMDAEKFDKYLGTFTEKVVDLDQHAHLEASAPDGGPTMEDLRASRKSGGF